MTTVTILDGGMGRELQRSGAPFQQPEWSALALIDSPEHVAAVHESYVRAGAQVITTNAYAVVPFHIGEERFWREGPRLAGLAASLARGVADRHPGVTVAGCLPPVLGSYVTDAWTAEAARPILEVLVAEQAPDVDVWLAETLSSIAEVELVAAVLAGEIAAGTVAPRPLWVSFTIEDGMTSSVPAAPADAPRLRSGEAVADAVRAAASVGAEVVAFNCSQPEVMEPALLAARTVLDPAPRAGSVRLGAYANAFVLADEDGANESLHDIRDDVTTAEYVRWARRWVTAGATVIGGCCGVGPEHVSALSADLKAG